MKKNDFIPVEHIIKLTELYLGKRIKIKLKTGEIFTGTVTWYEENDYEEETGVECDWGFGLNNAVQNNKKFFEYIIIPDSQIIAYCPLEHPNTDDELKKLGL